MELLPTTTAMDFKASGGAEGSSNVTLTDALVRGRGLLPTPRTSDTNGPGHHGTGGPDLRTAVTLMPTPRATDGTKGGPNQKGSSGDLMLPSAAVQVATNWGPYEPAIRHWEAVLGRPAPAPTEPNAKGNHRLSPAFTEWMMGVPEGWITGVDISRNEQLKACGNGVVPQQAAAALKDMLVSFGASL
jgi:DNA (cytosine-5)-methyltransferase 1